ncbi:expressed unknown protein [Seminavis robusta]|uniref:BZIP domain-containing protein n=1 Tax=Seminavis robusta TaxID=568900 RepID=A0A9N8HEU8_9STRA|nr:expressed unknown protein [Seminavis robusta]|eukprot:Sro320_g116480.1 n/a (505) ;mRNA; r:23008-24778
MELVQESPGRSRLEEVVTDEFLAEVVGSTVVGEAVAATSIDFPLPSTIEAATGLLGGELGDYELNEFPSFFNVDSQEMSADLEKLGLEIAAEISVPSSYSAIPFVVDGQDHMDNSSKDTDTAEESSPGPAKTTSVAVATTTPNTAAKKRSAAEISEDEDASAASTPTPNKATRKQTARRVTRSASSTSNSPIMPVPVASDDSPRTTPTRGRLLAPKPTSPAPRRVSTAGCATTSIDTATNGSITVHGGRRIDTSTAHVKALTGTKGAAMCYETVSGTDLDTTVAIPNLAVADSLSAEEKAKFSRDRNRLHAKNTRIRKKAYVDELKKTLDVLVKERDVAIAAKKSKGTIEAEERDVRFRVVQEFLCLRGSNVQALARWTAILEEGVTLCMPNIDWNTTTSGGQGRGERTNPATKRMTTGVKELMKECNEFNSQLKNGPLTYRCDRSTLLMEGSTVVIDWTATSRDPKNLLSMRGTCRASFNPQSNKLHAVELFFDSTPLFGNNT